jgi:RNA polymerase sigma-70 factor, ECF subfamily
MTTTTTSDGRSRGRAAGKELSQQERLRVRATEMDLIRDAQAGSRAAFDALVRQYEHQVLRLALHLTGSEQDAEDIYQEAFLKAYRYLGNFRFECSFYTWIYRIVTNLCLDQLRRRKTRREDSAVVVDLLESGAGAGSQGAWRADSGRPGDVDSARTHGF